jgi:hypothetical protein
MVCRLVGMPDVPWMLSFVATIDLSAIVHQPLARSQSIIWLTCAAVVTDAVFNVE